MYRNIQSNEFASIHTKSPKMPDSTPCALSDTRTLCINRACYQMSASESASVGCGARVCCFAECCVLSYSNPAFAALGYSPNCSFSQKSLVVYFLQVCWSFSLLGTMACGPRVLDRMMAPTLVPQTSPSSFMYQATCLFSFCRTAGSVAWHLGLAVVCPLLVMCLLLQKKTMSAQSMSLHPRDVLWSRWKAWSRAKRVRICPERQLWVQSVSTLTPESSPGHEGAKARLDSPAKLYSTINPQYTYQKACELYGGAPRPLSGSLSVIMDWGTKCLVCPVRGGQFEVS